MLSNRHGDGLVHGVSGILWAADPRTREFRFVNQAAERLLGYPAAEWTSCPTFLEDRLHPDDKDAALLFWSEARQGNVPSETDWRMFAASGETVCLRVMVSGLSDENGVQTLYGMMIDVTESKRAERLWKGEACVLDLAARGAPLGRVLEAVSELLDRESAYGQSVIWLLESGNRLRRASPPRLPAALLEKIEAETLTPTSGAWGAAVHLKEPVVSADIASDGLWAGISWVVDEHGFRACWVTPILAPNRAVLGALAVFYREPHAPNHRERDIVNAATRLAETAINRHHAERALRESEERFTLAALGVYDGLWDWNFETNEIYFAPSWKSMLGYEEHEIGLGADEWFSRIHPEDLALVKAQLVAHVQGATTRYESEYRIQHKNGEWIWLHSRGRVVRGAGGRASRLVGTETNITEKKQKQVELQHHAVHDSVTGLPNRSLFMNLVSRTLGRANRRWDYNFAVLLLDLDRFKVINESLGPANGDRLLKAIAERLQSSVRPGDAVARLGGDEFGVLLDDIKDVEDATRISGRIQKDLSLPFNLNDQVVYTTASIGIATSVHGYEEPDDILRDADTALYRAKAQGRARHEIFETGMHTRAMALLRLDTDLRRALDQREFLLHYQPIVCLKTGTLSAFEALARWKHPERGFLPPNEFIPVAEETGLIVPIGRFVLHEACRQMKIWRERFHEYANLAVSVNVSGKQLTEVDLVADVRQVLSETGLAPEGLKLEITETVIMENAESTAKILNNLRALNVHVMIDDFGTGYSSLSYLHRLPLDALKIDRFFIMNMGKKEGNAAIVRTILKLGQGLGMDVVAEGVETVEQMNELRELRCTFGQGYHFAKPMDAEAAEALLRSSPRWLEPSLVAAKPQAG